MIDLEHLAKQARTAEPPAFEGDWHAIEFQPDLTSPQSFIIGAAVSRRGKLVGYRVAQEAPRLKCFYGNRFAKPLWSWVRDEVQAELQKAMHCTVSKFQSGSPQIRLSAGHFVSGSSHDAALNRVFSRIVCVVGGETAPRAEGIDQRRLREQVNGLLKVSMSTRFEEVHHPNGIQIHHDGQTYAFDINFDDTLTASSIVSASYAVADTARLNVMQAVTDLFTYTRKRNRKQIGLAVLLPSPNQFPRETVTQWSRWWADESFKLRESDLVLLAEDITPEGLAEKVYDWYPAAT